MEIYLLRHGQTTQPGTYTGISDVDLSATGRHQIRSLSVSFSDITFDRCFCSPLLRCRNTFNLLAINTACTIAENLKEIDFGSWEGLSFDQVKSRYPGDVEKWERDGDDFQFPQGDTIAAFYNRVSHWFDKLMASEFNRVLIVTHGGVLRCSVCHLLGISQKHRFSFNFEEGSVSKVVADNGFTNLEYLNCKG